MKFLKVVFILVFHISTIFSQTVEEFEAKIDGASGLEKVQFQLQLSNKIVDSDAKKALSLSKQALKNSEGNTTLEGAANALIAQASINLKAFDDAITYGIAAANYYKSADKNNYAMSEAVVAEAYEGKGKTNESIDHYKNAFEAYTSLGKNKNAGYNASSLGMIFNKKNDIKNATLWYGKAADQFKSAGKGKDEVQCLKTIGAIYSNYGDYTNAKTAMTNALSAANSYGMSDVVKDLENDLALINNNASSSSSTTAFENEKIKETEQFISNIKMQNAKSLAEIEMMSEEVQLAELKIKAAQDEATLSFLQKEAAEDKAKLAESIADAAKLEAAEAKAVEEKIKAEKDAEMAKSQNLWIALGAVMMVAILILIGFLNKRKTNNVLTAKNSEIIKQKDEISVQSNKIMESIDYATRIQKALLPSQGGFKNILPGSFVFLKPKDSVSGDFFWYHQMGNEVIIVAADCTGHGVPGAFMSIIFSSLLEKVILDEKVTSPDHILETVSAVLTAKLTEGNVENNDFKDGMDVAIIKLNKITRKLEYSGARNGIYIVRDGELQDVKGTRRSVELLKSEETLPFALEHFDLNQGDKIFMFSDGFADQKGGEKGKKFYYAPFKDLLLEMSQSNENVTAQLNTVHEKWRGNNEQFDDILVVGIHIA